MAVNAWLPGYLQGNQELWGGEGRALGQYGKNYFDPYSQAGDQGISLYSDALGLGGAQGNQRAQGAFQVSPGYQFALGQGLQGVERSASSRGFLGSGNTAMALNDYAQGQANQEYGNWLSRLQGLGAQGLQAAAGQTGRQGNLADINMWGAGARGNLWQNAGNMAQRAMESEATRQQARRDQIFNAIFGGLNLAGRAYGGLRRLGVGGR